MSKTPMTHKWSDPHRGWLFDSARCRTPERIQAQHYAVAGRGRLAPLRLGSPTELVDSVYPDLSLIAFKLAFTSFFTNATGTSSFAEKLTMAFVVE